MENIIKLDYDEPTGLWRLTDFQERLRFVQDITGIIFSSCRYFRSKGGNVHVRLETPAKLESLEILALQAILGSDWKRETFNLRRIRRGQKNWNILFDHEEVKVK